MAHEQAEDGDAPIADHLLTTRQTMIILRISRATLYRLVERGALHPVHIGRGLRFTATEVRTYLRVLMNAARGR